MNRPELVKSIKTFLIIFIENNRALRVSPLEGPSKDEEDERHARKPSIFMSQNIVDDPMINLIDTNGIIVDYCDDYDYFDIVGLTEEELKEFEDSFDVHYF